MVTVRYHLCAGVALLALISAGCEVHTDATTRTIVGGVSYSDATKHQRLKDALSQSGIPYTVEIEKGAELLRWDASYDAQVQRIEDSLFLPSGRNIRLDPDRQSRFKTWLDQNGIPYRTMIEDDGEYIVWDEADADRVRSWREFPSHYDNPASFENK